MSNFPSLFFRHCDKSIETELAGKEEERDTNTRSLAPQAHVYNSTSMSVKSFRALSSVYLELCFYTNTRER